MVKSKTLLSCDTLNTFTGLLIKNCFRFKLIETQEYYECVMHHEGISDCWNIFPRPKISWYHLFAIPFLLHTLTYSQQSLNSFLVINLILWRVFLFVSWLVNLVWSTWLIMWFGHCMKEISKLMYPSLIHSDEGLTCMLEMSALEPFT